MTGFALAVWAQSSGGSALVIRINPEAHLSPASTRLSFLVPNPAEIAISTPVTITAWVRALPNRQIRLTAQAVNLTGPVGAIPLGTIAWNGTMTSTPTGGAAAAACTSGSFGAGGPKKLISGWTRSGIAVCTVTFTLATDAAWPQGAYSGQVDFSLLAQ
jgi:hypothetical protein